MQLVTARAMKAIVDLWCFDQKLAPEGKFYCEDNGVWVGCDNDWGHCWVEEFKTKEDVMKWFNDEPVCDVNNYSLNDWAEETQQND